MKKKTVKLKGDICAKRLVLTSSVGKFQSTPLKKNAPSSQEIVFQGIEYSGCCSKLSNFKSGCIDTVFH
jgi:hypothetical protein